ncbi:MAG: stage V sporulation protein K [Lactobacillus iners]|nr:stage V sporulation protein K [Lactobacillus iners]MCT7746732.1 stage V sporulation protein K [Lactobacillus iners]
MLQRLIFFLSLYHIIDGAYALTPDGQNSFKQEAIDRLVTLSNELRNDIGIILAGYSQPMKKFLQANEGLAVGFLLIPY